MSESGLHGAIIEQGPRDWQILQQTDGRADIALAGRWTVREPEQARAVEARVVYENTGLPVTADLDWRQARTNADGTWSITLLNVPAGGLYRIETHLRTGTDVSEWARRGDMRHFVGVGDLWIIAGQSNSAGYGRGPVDDPPRLGVHMFDNAMRWRLASQPLNESTDSAHLANTEGGNPAHSPWLMWAKLVSRRLGRPIGLIQTSLGGSALWQWNPSEPGESGGRHVLFDTMVHAVRAAGGRARGMLWYQGCSDCGPNAGTYGSRFAAAVQLWRRELNCPDLFIVTVQLNRVLGQQTDQAHEAWSLLRDCQRRAAHELSGVTVTPTLDLPLSDGIHTSAAGNMVLGARCADAALGAAYGLPVAWKAPEAVAAVPAADARAVEVRFANVFDRLAPLDGRDNPFRLTDSQGVMPIEKVQYPAPDTVRLVLSREVRGQAMLSGACGANPPPAPFDMARMMPMLAFHNMPVTGTTAK